MGEGVGIYGAGPHGHGGELAGIDLDALVEKAGGRFRLVTLIQRRMRDLQRGAPPLVERASANLMQASVEEYHKDKIWLVEGEEAEKLRLMRQRESSQRGPQGSPRKEAGGAEPGAPQEKGGGT